MRERPGDETPAADADPDLRPFTALWARVAAAFIALLLVAVAAIVLWRAPILVEAGSNAAVPQAVTIGIVLVLGILLLWRLAGVRADPDAETGLRVRNIIYTRTLAWAEIVAISFTPSNSWAMIDVSDGTRLAVMGIQQADGQRGRNEVARLRRLVDRYGAAPAEAVDAPRQPEA